MKRKAKSKFVKGLNIKMFKTKYGFALGINIRFDLLYHEFADNSKDGKNLNVICFPRERIGDSSTTHYVLLADENKKDIQQFNARGHFGVGAIDSERKDPDYWNEDLEDQNYQPPNF